ncbi:hypothetical protein Q5M85_11230 [Paraclostridium bifermentans]|nr:hypothetical protein [Paraclostridium bifermentans]
MRVEPLLKGRQKNKKAPKADLLAGEIAVINHLKMQISCMQIH